MAESWLETLEKADSCGEGMRNDNLEDIAAAGVTAVEVGARPSGVLQNPGQLHQPWTPTGHSRMGRGGLHSWEGRSEGMGV